jgi:uncharacterized OB-fold protein
MDVKPAIDSPLTADRPKADLRAGKLSGSRCTACAAPSWPARAVCHRCGSPALRYENFSEAGSLITYTTVYVPRPGLQTPYTLGQVHFEDNGPVVFGHVRGLANHEKVPCRVRLALAEDPVLMPWYWFVPFIDEQR